MIIFLLLFLPGVRVEEATPSNLLSPRNFNLPKLPFKAVQFLTKTSKKGPILFPNDGPPPDPTPLIVTSRPLIESIRRSDLNSNNTVQAQSQINAVTFRPKLLARLKEYKPFVYNAFDVPTRYQFENTYAEVVKKKERNRDYNDYEVSSPYYVTSLHDNDAREVNSNEDDHGENYAFSYKVQDHKTGDDFSHSQSSSGSATNGEYRVRLPDGRMQIVSYTADENGYKADVRYDDHDIPTNGNENEAQTNKNNHKNINYYDNQNNYENYKIESPKTVSTSSADDKSHTDNIGKNIVNRNHDYNDRHSDYLLTDNYNAYVPQYNQNNNTVYYNNNIFKERNEDNDYYHYTDDSASKEYKDYSNEFDYQPYKSKYAAFVDIQSKPSSKPSYEELKNIFIKNLFDNPRYKLVSTTMNPHFDATRLNSHLVSSTVNPNFYESRLNIQSVSSTINPEVSRLNMPSISSTSNPKLYESRLNFPLVSSTISPNFESTTENVVIIGLKKPAFFTNIKNSIPVNFSPSPLTYSTPIPTIGPTPSSYLISTITNLKNKISLSNKPELSNKFIDKINKYLSFK